MAWGMSRVTPVALRSWAFDDIAPRLTVIKAGFKDDVGTLTVVDFLLNVDAVSVTSGVDNTFSAGLHAPCLRFLHSSSSFVAQHRPFSTNCHAPRDSVSR